MSEPKISERKNSFELIYDVIRQIPYGKVASYGQIAELAGNRHWSRVVGYALHAVPADSDLPCHRVVTRNGELSRAFETDGINRQAGLLEAEGIILRNGNVPMETYQWNRRLF